MQTVGITGAHGFIGKNLVSKLRETARYEVKEFTGDITRPVDVEQFVSQCNTVVHLAAINRHENNFTILDTNVGGTYLIAKNCIEFKTRLFVAGTTKRYGAYGASKLLCHDIVSRFAAIGLTGSYLVLPNVFGPHCKPFYNSFITTILWCMANGKPYAHLVVDEKATVRVIHVSDVVANIENFIAIDAVYVEECSVDSTHKIEFYNSGEFPITIDDFCLVAQRKDPKYRVPQRAIQLIHQTMDWYKQDALDNQIKNIEQAFCHISFADPNTEC